MALSVIVLGVLLAIWPTPALRLAGGRAHSANALRVVGIAAAALALLMAFLVGP